MLVLPSVKKVRESERYKKEASFVEKGLRKIKVAR